MFLHLPRRLSLVVESLTDSPPPHQVVDLNDMWWLDEQMQQLDVSVDEPAADDESPQFYARLNRMLAGPGYADGRSASKLPILSSHQEDWDLLQWVEPIVEGQTAKEQEFILSFGDAWRRNARALRKEGSQSTPIEDEMCLVLTLLSASISSLARAVMRQDRGGEKRIIQSMEMAIEGFSLLSRIDRQARQKCRASTEHA